MALATTRSLTRTTSQRRKRLVLISFGDQCHLGTTSGISLVALHPGRSADRCAAPSEQRENLLGFWGGGLQVMDEEEREGFEVRDHASYGTVDSKSIPISQHTTTKYMSKYEKARVLGTRALQIR